MCFLSILRMYVLANVLISQQNWLHNLPGPLQNENAGPLAQKVLRILRQRQPSIEQGPCGVQDPVWLHRSQAREAGCVHGGCLTCMCACVCCCVTVCALGHEIGTLFSEATGRAPQQLPASAYQRRGVPCALFLAPLLPAPIVPWEAFVLLPLLEG